MVVMPKVQVADVNLGNGTEATAVPGVLNVEGLDAHPRQAAWDVRRRGVERQRSALAAARHEGQLRGQGGERGDRHSGAGNEFRQAHVRRT